MSSKKFKIVFFSFILFLFLSVFSFCLTYNILEISIDIAPNVINLQQQGQVLTVHTDIAYSSVEGSTVTLNGLEINYWKSDDRGNFVAKFLTKDIKSLDLIVGSYNNFILVGTTVSGETFTGEQEILVVNNIPMKKQK